LDTNFGLDMPVIHDSYDIRTPSFSECRDPQILGWGSQGSRGRVSENYSVSCTESMLENVFFIRKIC